jgi:UDP-GlcNAc:undecaprenyl-phosphate GlcNAc-1-phosphate transferase
MMLIPLLVRVAPFFGIVDEPGPRKVHTESVPRIGGIAIYLGCIVPLFIFLPETRLFFAVLVSLTILFAFGLWDDKSDINFRYKFIGQIVSASIVVYWGGATIHNFPFINDYGVPEYIANIFTVILLVGVTNAVNMSDGLDGLAGGTSILAIACMTFTAYLSKDTTVVVLGASLIGATLGFLRFNTYPARIFMGDAGSQLLGFSSGLICILVTQQSNTALSPMMAVIVLGLPLIDILTVMAIRVSEGRSPFSADKNHIHHMFLIVGFSHREAVFIIYTMQIALVVAAFLMRYSPDIVLLLFYAVFCVSLLSMIYLTKQHPDSAGAWVIRLQHYLAKLGVNSDLKSHRKFSYYTIRVLFSAILMLGVVCLSEIPKDFGFAAILLLIMLLLTLLIKNSITNAIRRLCLYVTAGFIVYFMELSQQDGGLIATYLPFLFVIVGVVVAILIKREGGSVREFSSLDFLLLAMALIVSLFPDSKVMDGIDATLVIEIVVLFYAIDVLFNRRERLEKLVIGSAIISLLVIISNSVL